MCEDTKEKQKFKLVITDVFTEGVQRTTWQSETCASANFLGSDKRSIASLTHIHREDILFPCTIQIWFLNGRCVVEVTFTGYAMYRHWNRHFLFFFNYSSIERIIALQNFAVFCQTSTWISHRYTYIPSLLNFPPHPTTLGWYRAPVWVSWAIQQIPVGYLFHIW